MARVGWFVTVVLITALAFVVNNLSMPKTIIPIAEKLAVGHLDYGVKEEHYPVVGQALLQRLEIGWSVLLGALSLRGDFLAQRFQFGR